MGWHKTIRYTTHVNYDGEVHAVVAEKEGDEDFCISIDGEYVCDTPNIPTHEELLEFVDNKVTLDRMAGFSYPRR